MDGSTVANGVVNFFNAPVTSNLSVWKLLALLALACIVMFYVNDTLHHFNGII